MNKYVIRIQEELKRLGLYKGEVDGDLGPLSMEAFSKLVEGYQSLPKPLEVIPTEAPPMDGVIPGVSKSGFVLSDKSLSKFQGVNGNLVNVVKRAIQLSEVDFVVTEGLRTVERQRQLVAKGLSKTMKSNHITGRAVDLAAYVNGSISWNFDYYYKIAKAMQLAAKELGVRIVWGGSWHCLNDTNKDPTELVEIYKANKKAQGRTPFLDGPHFELA